MPIGPSEQKLLFQVRRRLATMGVDCQFTARGDALKGTITFEGEQVVPNPLGSAAIEEIAFTVRGDGSMHVDRPEPARGLQGPDAMRLPSVDALAQALKGAVEKRAYRVLDRAARLKALGLESELDADRLSLTARMDLGHLGSAELVWDGLRVVARDLVDAEGQSRKSFSDLEIDLDGFEDRVDLELFLSSHAEMLVPELAAKSVVSGHLGPDSFAKPEVEVAAEEEHVEPPAQAAPLAPPNVGSVWVMDVHVESDDGEEVRYQGVNSAGHPYGAPRVLPKIAFDSAYHAAGGGYRMLVQVSDVGNGAVYYLKLDAQRRPVGVERSTSIAGFLANFVAENATY